MGGVRDSARRWSECRVVDSRLTVVGRETANPMIAIHTGDARP
jgi:hypothetical protein